jgi:hypothetical protein
MTLFSRIQLYLRRSGVSASRFGRDVLGDPNFVGDLRSGREPRLATVRQILAYLDEKEDAKTA